MQTEVARQGLPLGIIPLAKHWWGGLDRRRRRALRQLSTGPLKGLANGLARLVLPMQIRDFEAFQDELVAIGLAARGPRRRLARPMSPVTSSSWSSAALRRWSVTRILQQARPPDRAWRHRAGAASRPQRRRTSILSD